MVTRQVEEEEVEEKTAFRRLSLNPEPLRCPPPLTPFDGILPTKNLILAHQVSFRLAELANHMVSMKTAIRYLQFTGFTPYGASIPYCQSPLPAHYHVGR